MLKTGYELSREEIIAAYARLGERRGLGPEFIEIALGLAGDLTGRKVLDVGCGYGELLGAAAKVFPGAEFYGVDFSPDRVIAASLSNVKTLKVDIEAERLPFPDNFFDAVFCTEVLEHLRAPAGCLGEIRRVVKKSGKVVFSVPNAGGFFPFNKFSNYIPTAWLRRKLLPYEHPANTDQPVDTCYEYGEIVALVAGAGFSIERGWGWRYFRYLQMLPVLRIFYGIFEARLERLMNGLALEKYAYNLFLVCSDAKTGHPDAGQK
ncbi:MAG: hypothetical protein A2X35_06185 [Elusimicrobia bacterium GWA2_61_42]|nr:MAG: hypothetical protein A2X35_06185 [Elusimicrobia bacterium GWA2_61_42]OGR78741.1 MAG: hypothetical protein A2X38_04130 [Elusimicrobia bacterium GWC2_61_25]